MSQPRRARVRALAKINLDLRVLGKRSDGFHELRTVFQTISLADTLEIAYTPARKTETSISTDRQDRPKSMLWRLVERATVMTAPGSRLPTVTTTPEARIQAQTGPDRSRLSW